MLSKVTPRGWGAALPLLTIAVLVAVGVVIHLYAKPADVARAVGLGGEYRPAPPSELDVGVMLARQEAVEKKLAMLALDQAKQENTLKQFGFIRETVVHVVEQQEKHAAALAQIGVLPAAAADPPAPRKKQRPPRKAKAAAPQTSWFSW